MEVDDETLFRLKANADRKIRDDLDAASRLLTKSNLIRNLAWALGIMALGLIYVTGWAISNDYAIEQLRTGQGENRQYIRDLWSRTFSQPLPPPPTK